MPENCTKHARSHHRGRASFLLSFFQKVGAEMSDYIERLVACGMNLIDAYEVCDDFIYDSDYEGLAEYVRAVEQEYVERI